MSLGTVRYDGACDAQVRWGSNDDPLPLLVEGETYEVSNIEVHSQHTKIELVGIVGKFNDSSFTWLTPEAKAAAVQKWLEERWRGFGSAYQRYYNCVTASRHFENEGELP